MSAATLLGIETRRGRPPLNGRVIEADDASPLPGKLVATAYTLPETLSRDRWISIGATLQGIYGSIQWWIGDWFNFGEEHFGEEASQGVLEATELDRRSIRNYAWVCRRFSPERRRPKPLTFSHHYVVARLSYERPELSDQLLDRARDRTLTRDELSAVAKEVERQLRIQPVMPSPAVLQFGLHKAQAGLCPTCTCPIVTTPIPATNGSWGRTAVPIEQWPVDVDLSSGVMRMPGSAEVTVETDQEAAAAGIDRLVEAQIAARPARRTLRGARKARAPRTLPEIGPEEL